MTEKYEMVLSRIPEDLLPYMFFFCDLLAGHSVSFATLCCAVASGGGEC